MKTLLTIILVLILGLTVGYLAISHYDNYQKIREAAIVSDQADKTIETDKQIKAITLERDGAIERVKLISVECKKGIVAYNNLSTSLKRNIAVPDCTGIPE